MNTILLRNTRRLLLCLLLLALLPCAAFAAEREAMPDGVYCYCSNDFEDVAGIFVTAVPETSVGSIYYGSRAIQAGDFLDAAALERLTLKPNCDKTVDAVLTYRPVAGNALGAQTSLCVRIRSSKNEAPIAQDIELETYKNIANDGVLRASDPEGDAVTYKIETQPRFGSVTLDADGHFVYTPNEKKVGKDSFTYSATDAKGKISEPATVHILIKKPVDAVSYADMNGSESQFEAMWLCESGLLRGSSLLETPCFAPNATVSRGEFLVMVMKLANLAPANAALTSGFQDEADAPSWMRPYLTSAMQLGVTSGVQTERGLCFLPNRAITQQEAAVMLQKALGLPKQEVTDVFAASEQGSHAAAVWAQDALAALRSAELPVDANAAVSVLTREDAAKLLYAASKF